MKGNNNNFGELAPASLSGFVYLDANDNGLKEGGEIGLAATLTLTGTDDLGAGEPNDHERRHDGRLQLPEPAAGHVCDR